MNKYYCDICSKNYASYQSLWIHNKNFHSISNNNDKNLHQNSNKVSLDSNKISLDFNKNLINKKDFDKLQCYYCSIFLKNRFDKNYHIKKCKEKYPNVQIIDNNNYKCNICNKEFINKSSIYKHKKKCIDNQLVHNVIINDNNNIINNNTNNTKNINNIDNTNKSIDESINKNIIVEKSTDKKNKKKAIPVALKRKVWNKWIGESIGKSKCLCCNLTDIAQLNFSCGHIIPESNGGELKLDNLKPICISCNSSMGKTNMNNFISNNGL